MIFDKRYIFASSVKYNMLPQTFIFLFPFSPHMLHQNWLFFSRHMFPQNWLFFHVICFIKTG
eukprot:UN12816